jgi:hypothetical protein
MPKLRNASARIVVQLTASRPRNGLKPIDEAAGAPAQMAPFRH